MMKPKVYISRPIPAEVEAYIAEHCEYRKWSGEGPLGYEQMKTELADAEGLLTTGGRIDEGLLAHAPKLRVVSTISVGYNNMDIAAMKARGVIGTHTPYVLDDSVADLVLGLMLSVSRRIPEMDRFIRQGGWKRGDDRSIFGRDVHHATVGIIGMGRIGEAIAQRAKLGFSMNVLYYNRSRKPEAEARFGAEYCTLEELLARSDFVVLMTPLTAETTRFIGARHFALMKPTAYFINASRGMVVDEPALIEALQQGKIAGAGLDVFAKEPVDPANPLLRMDNVVAVPHIGSATAQTRFEMAMTAARNLVAAVKGETPPYLVPEFREE